MVMRLLGLTEKPSPADAADALALAICHLWREPMRARLAEAEARGAEMVRKHRARLAAAAKEANPAKRPIVAVTTRINKGTAR
jgi:crossover junction endodeoxyribonuclease RuvC